MGRRYGLAYDHNNMVPASASSATVQVIFKTEDGILDCYGNTVPTDATSGYAIGCTFRHCDGGDGTALYVNEGTATSCNFNAITVGS